MMCAVMMPGILGIGALRQGRVEFYLHQAGAGQDHVTGLAGHAIANRTDIGSGFEFSFTGLLAALLAFVLAEVFEQARRLRDDLEGTV